MLILLFRFSLKTTVTFFSSRRRHTRFDCDWSSDVCSSDLFERKLLEVEAVGCVVIGGDRFGIVVYHYRPVPFALARMERLYARPVEFHGGTYRIRTASEYRDLLCTAYDVVLGAVVGEVEVIRFGGEFPRERVYLFDHGEDLEAFAERADSGLGRLFNGRELGVGKSRLLGASHQGRMKFLTLQLSFGRDYVLHLVQEPRIDRG